eukprot:7591447-Lingulodinium_polyedra.AAC.1
MATQDSQGKVSVPWEAVESAIQQIIEGAAAASAVAGSADMEDSCSSISDIEGEFTDQRLAE